MILECLLLFYSNIYLSVALTIDLRSDISSVLLNEGDFFQIFCPYFDNYRFFYPNNSAIKNKALSIYEKETVCRTNESVIKTGVFELSKTVYRDTGWYGCARFNTTASNYVGAMIHRVYVYVQSRNNLFVNKEDSIKFLQKDTSDSITFPCRPTSPNYTVKLFHDENVLLNSDRVRFDPREGFSIRNLTIRDNGHYVCRIRNLDCEEEVSFFLYVTSKMKKINRPIITNKNWRNNVIEGQDLQLNCSVEIDSTILYSLNWFVPNKNKLQDTEEQYFENSLGINFYQKIKQLTVRNVSKHDHGEYECCIESGFIRECVKKFISVHDSSFGYLRIISSDSNVHYIKNCNDSITWIVKYDAYPSPEVQWVHPKFIILQTSRDINYELQITAQRVLLRIKSLSRLDSGIHKLSLANRMDQKIITINLFVDCN